MATVGCGADGEQPSNPGEGGGAGGGIVEPKAGLEPWPCPPGALELADGSCLPAGIEPDACGEGFVPDGQRGCEAVLPPAPCPPGLMAIPGETSCREIAPCGAGPWGDIPVEANTQYVDGSYAGGDSDGSADKPWTSISDALGVTPLNAIVAIAAGSYHESPTVVAQPVRLWGKCPSQVELVGEASAAGLRFESASHSEVRDLTIRGGSMGLTVRGGTVTVDRVRIHETAAEGAYALDSSAVLTVTRSLVEDTVYDGVASYGGQLSVSEAVVRDVSSGPDGSQGRGVSGYYNKGQAAAASLEVDRSLITRTQDAGVYVWGAAATVTNTAIIAIAPDGKGRGGQALRAVDTELMASSVTLRRSLLSDTTQCGISVWSSDLYGEHVTIRGVSESPLSQIGTLALAAVDPDWPARPADLTLRSSTLEQGIYAGVIHHGSVTSLEGVIVRDVTPPASGALGVGIGARQDMSSLLRSTASVDGCLVERATGLGIAISSSDATIQSTLVRDVRGETTSVGMGRGVSIEVDPQSYQPSSAILRNCWIERTRGAGVAVLGSNAVLSSCLIRDTQAQQLDGLFGRGLVVQASLEGQLPASAQVSHSLIDGSRDVGIAVASAELELDHTIVRNTLPQLGTDRLGDGVAAMFLSAFGVGAHATVTDSIIETSARAGLVSFGSNIEVSGTLLRCNSIHLNSETSGLVQGVIADEGGNTCTCDGEVTPCRVLSSQLEPPQAL